MTEIDKDNFKSDFLYYNCNSIVEGVNHLKTYILEKCLNIVRISYPEYDEDKLDEIRYGLEAIYLSITKVVVIFFLAYLLGILKETFCLCLAFNVLRLSGFGLHATKSWMCWVSSIIVFLVIPYCCTVVQLPQGLMIALAFIFEVNLLLFAPADTKKRPLIHKRKRACWKMVTGITGCIFLYFILSTENTLVQNILLSAMLIEGALVNPFVYKIFKLPYNNYKTYVYSTNIN